MNDSPLTIEKASVHFGDTKVLDGVSFEVSQGKILGIANFLNDAKNLVLVLYV